MMHIPRPLSQIVADYNELCDKDDLLIEEMSIYKENEVPWKLLKRHIKNEKKLVELDAERNYALPFQHNLFRNHYAMMYPVLLNKSIIKFAKK